MRVRIAVMRDDQVLDDSFAVNTLGDEVTQRDLEEIGRGVVAQLQRVHRRAEDWDEVAEFLAGPAA